MAFSCISRSAANQSRCYAPRCTIIVAAIKMRLDIRPAGRPELRNRVARARFMRPGDYLTPRAIGERDARDGTSARKSLMNPRSACDEFKDTKRPWNPRDRKRIKRQFYYYRVASLSLVEITSASDVTRDPRVDARLLLGIHASPVRGIINGNRRTRRFVHCRLTSQESQSTYVIPETIACLVLLLGRRRGECNAAG